MYWILDRVIEAGAGDCFDADESVDFGAFFLALDKPLDFFFGGHLDDSNGVGLRSVCLRSPQEVWLACKEKELGEG